MVLIFEHLPYGWQRVQFVLFLAVLFGQLLVELPVLFLELPLVLHLVLVLLLVEQQDEVLLVLLVEQQDEVIVVLRLLIWCRILSRILRCRIWRGCAGRCGGDRGRCVPANR